MKNKKVLWAVAALALAGTATYFIVRAARKGARDRAVANRLAATSSTSFPTSNGLTEDRGILPVGLSNLFKDVVSGIKSGTSDQGAAKSQLDQLK